MVWVWCPFSNSSKFQPCDHTPSEPKAIEKQPVLKEACWHNDLQSLVFCSFLHVSPMDSCKLASDVWFLSLTKSVNVEQPTGPKLMLFAVFESRIKRRSASSVVCDNMVGGLKDGVCMFLIVFLTIFQLLLLDVLLRDTMLFEHQNLHSSCASEIRPILQVKAVDLRPAFR